MQNLYFLLGLGAHRYHHKGNSLFSMAVEGTTGQLSLFYLITTLASTAAYAGIQCLLQRKKWYAVDISLVLNAMTYGRGVTDFARTQQCVPPMASKKSVFRYFDEWFAGSCRVRVSLWGV